MLSVCLICDYTVGYENHESLVRWLLLRLSELSQNLFSYLYLRTLFPTAIITSCEMSSSYFVNYSKDDIVSQI